MSHGRSGKGVAYFDDPKEVPGVAVASMNARDDAFKIWKARRHLTNLNSYSLSCMSSSTASRLREHETVP